MLDDQVLREGLRVVLNSLIPDMRSENVAKAGFHLSVQEVVVRVFEVEVLAARAKSRSIFSMSFLKYQV